MRTNKESSHNMATILVVDDVYSNREILVEILESEGYKVNSVGNGHFALISAENEKPDLILLDIMMPDMDGYEVCLRLKGNPKTKNIPVIFISALDNTSDIVKALNSGGVDYITKPFIDREVIARVATYLRVNKQNQIIQKQKQKLQKLDEVIKVLKSNRK